jgi:hypothetical protein
VTPLLQLARWAELKEPSGYGEACVGKLAGLGVRLSGSATGDLAAEVYLPTPAPWTEIARPGAGAFDEVDPADADLSRVACVRAVGEAPRLLVRRMLLDLPFRESLRCFWTRWPDAVATPTALALMRLPAEGRQAVAFLRDAVALAHQAQALQAVAAAEDALLAPPAPPAVAPPASLVAEFSRARGRWSLPSLAPAGVLLVAGCAHPAWALVGVPLALGCSYAWSRWRARCPACGFRHGQSNERMLSGHCIGCGARLV